MTETALCCEVTRWMAGVDFVEVGIACFVLWWLKAAVYCNR